jgi:hypothetical protein
VPPQAGHFVRIKATPSDLPFKFTGFAMYPVPPQFGQSSGSTPLPLIVEGIFYEAGGKSTGDCFALRNPNKMKQLHGCKEHGDESQLSFLGVTTRPGCASYLLVLQLPETFFTLVTLNVWDPPALLADPAPALAPAPLAPDAVPLTSTSLFTWALSFELSP